MALGVDNLSEHSAIWNIPFLGINEIDNKNNKWLIDHLRQLANKIERENPEIIKIMLEYDKQYKVVFLKMEVYNENKE
jgi:hypothetical protein